MDAARVKALELTLVAIQFGLPVKDAQSLLEVADLFRAYIEPSKRDDTVNPADGDDYPRMQPSGYDDSYSTIPGRY